jgi:superfamily II DNA or RNA helicase
MMKELRQYQTIGIDKLATKFSRGIMRIIFQLATGGGKTVTFAGLINRYLQRHQKRVLILVHREELLKQACSTLFQWYDISAAPVTANTTYLPNVMVYVAMVETANNRLKKNPKYFGNIGLVIVDECHIGNFKKLYDHFNDALIIGFTATPISSSKKDPLKNHFHDIVCGIDIPELIEQGSLVPNKTYHLRNVNRKELKIKNGEFDEREMGRMFSGSKFVQNCIAAYKEFGAGKKTIVFNCNIEHSKKVNEAFLAFSFPSRHLDGESDPRYRTETLLWFKRTPGAILNNVGILTTGFDEPSVEAVMINRSTMSIPLWLQMTGRGSRPFPGKDHFVIIDMGSNAITHGDWCEPRDWSDAFFNPEKPKEGGEAPVKECVGCKVMIHASYKICPHCGALNTKPVVYDEDVIALELLDSRQPFGINIEELIAEWDKKLNAAGEPYKPLAQVHEIKRQLIFHAQRIWRLKRIDGKTAYRLLTTYQDNVRKWCKLKSRPYDSWLDRATREWLFDEFRRVFKWEEKKEIV